MSNPFLIQLILLTKSLARDGKRPGDAVRAGRGRGAVRDARGLPAAVLRHHPRHGDIPVADLRLHLPDSETAAAEEGDSGDGGEVRAVGDPAAVRVRGEFPGAEVSAGAEQDMGDDGGLGGRAGVPRGAELGFDHEARDGAGGGGDRGECDVVAGGAGAGGLCFVRVF